MKRRKNLERAIVLGLLLSTSVYGSAWAEEIGAIDATASDAEYTTETEYTITTTGNKNGITVGDGHQVIIGSEQNNNVNTVTINAGDSGLTSKNGGGTVIINANDEISITGSDMFYSALSAGAAGTEYSLNSAKISINGDYGGAINIGSNSIISITAAGTNDTENNDIVNNIVSTSASGTINLSAGELNITAEKGSNYIESTAGSGVAISTSNLGTANVIATNGQNIIKAGGYGIRAQGSNVTLTALSNEITANNRGVYAYKNEGTTVDIKAEGTGENGYNEVYGMFTGVYAGGQNETGRSEVNEIKLTADNGKNIITQGNKDRAWTNTSDAGVYAAHNGKVTMTALANEITADNEGVEGYLNSDITITATNGDNKITSNWSGIKTNERRAQEGEGTYSAKIKLLAQNGDNIIESGKDVVLGKDSPNEQEKYHGYGIHARYSSDVKLTAYGDNIIKAGNLLEENNGYYNGIAIGAGVGTSDSSHTVVTLEAADKNELNGAIYAGSYAKVYLQGIADGQNQYTATNTINSAAVIDDAGELESLGDSKFEGKQVVSALYAEYGAQVKLTGENYIGTFANYKDTDTLERTVWAYQDADIQIDGATKIGTNNYLLSPNSADVAIAAGTAAGLTSEMVEDFNDTDPKAVVNINYKDFDNGNGRSSIEGDILAAYAGEVNIKPFAETARTVNNTGITINGNLLAGNKGKMTVELGNGGRLTGRIDDYQDAGTEVNNAHLSFYNPAFSSTIYGSGEVNLKMGNNSYWNVTGQSWVTSLSGEGSIIDMRNDNENLNSSISTNANETPADNNSHAVHIGTLTGNNTFVMDLNDANHNISDMLYIKDEANSSGTHTVFLNSVVGLENMQDGDKLRFATVNAGEEQLKFVGEYEGENGYTGNRSRAMLNDIGFNNVAFEIKNETYSEADSENTGYNGTEFDRTKPGDKYVDTEYGNGATNWYITRNSSGDETSDGGKTILNMSRANYSNAIYMDRLNKRLGEARYINDDPEEDEGMWVRVRHDRIGKDDAFRSQNTMYQLGYDKRQESDNGKRRVGFAVDYMHGDTGYNDIAGKGEIDRYGLWLYDTWTGDKGHYADYVAKWGHLDNEFEIYAPTTGKRIDGDYSNNVFSISAEYGRKKDMGNDWYFEPQAQLQLARVTGADYTTSQGTKVSVDGINSLIGRAGFRIGKDFGEQKQSTLYFKADVLHEFLGDQTIRAMDGTTNGWQTVDYENQGTWYDIGIGYAAMLSQSTYAFVDLEQSFGNDNDDTYQINAGVRWTF